MSKIKLVHDSIFNCSEDIIAHQVNCQGVMGAGLAKQIKDRYSDVYKSYVELCEYHSNSREKLLGTILIGNEGNDDKIIANLFAQYGYGSKQVQTDYNALKKCFESLRAYASKSNKSIAIPYGIGCGLAGGDWNTVCHLIVDIYVDYGICIYHFGNNYRI